MQELIKGACGYLDKIGPAVMSGMYELLEADGRRIRPEEWQDLVTPGWELTLNIISPPPPPPRMPEFTLEGHRVREERSAYYR